MARPTTIRDETILDAARAVFLRHGFGATTAQVAEEAGVSEGTLFNRFRTKEELFQRSMSSKDVEHPFLVDLVAKAGTGTVRDNLVEAGTALLGHFRQIMPLIMMAWSNPVEAPMNRFQRESGPERNRRLVAAYFAAEMDAGRIRRADPEAMMWAFVGPLFHATFAEVSCPKRRVRPVGPSRPPREVAEGAVDLLLRGALPAKGPAPKRTKLRKAPR